MFTIVATNDPLAVKSEVHSAYLDLYPAGDPQFVNRVFGWVEDSFAGEHPDYQASDARYHDLEHTMQGTLCFTRLLHCRSLTGAVPEIPQRNFELGLIGILLHDTGYLKRRNDPEGTGAKYTATHVLRSLEFTNQLLAREAFPLADIRAVQNMIRCTGIDVFLESISFASAEDRLVGHALGTADLLGQMAAEDYVEKLPVLYAEFQEAAQHDRGHTDFITKFGGAQNLIARTPAFWRHHVLPKLQNDFGGLYRFLNDPYPDGRNWYLERINANIERIERELAAKC
ncbi:MAG TPA: hypothetical protein PKN95_06370 [Verrucomicrobiota bacterium]|nr:hypothetical protein [Verrucomicrobiota bacterium]HNT15603.1 hypothetical protein [Verrucomicrobiota bacterium]